MNTPDRAKENRLFLGMLLFLFIFILSCKTIPKKLTIADLNITELLYTDSLLARYKITQVYYLSQRDSNSERASDIYARVDLDTLGRGIFSYTYPPYGGSYNLAYDSIGLLSRLTYVDRDESYTIKHLFDAGQKLLTEYWSGSIQDTCFYYFDAGGKLVRSFSFLYNAPIPSAAFKSKKEYFYASDGLLKMTVFTDIENFRDTAKIVPDTGQSAAIQTVYFYRGKIPDSAITTFLSKDLHRTKRTALFDGRGLSFTTTNEDGTCFENRYR